MQCRKQLALIFITFLFSSNSYAQQIDDRIARELGLVKASSTGVKSDVFDISLNVGAQTEVVFPEQGTLSIKPKDSMKFEFLNVNNSLFIRPLVEIKKEIVATFELTHSKRAVVLRLKTDVDPIDSGVIVLNLKMPVAVSPAIERTNPSPSLPAVPGPSFTKGTDYDQYVLLVSFAARSAYAPDRLLNPPKGLARQAIKASAKQANRIIRDRRLSIEPLSSYAYRGVFVTVVELKNKSASQIKLMPELIRGNFVAKSFQHTHLGAAKRDKYSALYLISQRPFDDIVEEL